MKKFITLLLFTCLLTSCDYFYPKVVNKGKAVVYLNNYIISSSDNCYNNKYVLEVQYIEKDKGKKIGRGIYSDKKIFSDFKVRDTVEVYSEYFSKKEFIVDKHNKRHYFTKKFYLL